MRNTARIVPFTLALALLAGCAGTRVISPSSSASPSAPQSASSSEAQQALKTGLALAADTSLSKGAADENGCAQTDVLCAAVTVGEDGVIRACALDQVQVKVEFDNAGALVTPAGEAFATKNELGDSYGMRKASSIGKEWNEQADAFARWAVGKTADEVRAVPVDEKGRPTGADLVSQATVSVTGFADAVARAAESAETTGAQASDELRVAVIASAASSKDADEADGLAQADVNVAAVTWRDGTVTSCVFDAVQSKVTFDAHGALTSDASQSVRSKNELGEEYGMKQASSIGREWNEQAASFARYAAGKTADELTGIAVTEKGAPADADIASEVTISVGGFLKLIEKAAAA